MKALKKCLAVLLAAVMVMAMGVTAFAVDATSAQYSITIKNAQAGETYKIYKMLDLSVSDDETSFSYYLNTDWAEFFKTGAGKDYVSIADNTGSGQNEFEYVTWKNGKDGSNDMEAFGKSAAAFAANKDAAATKTPDTDTAITFDKLTPGYYLVTSTNGTLAVVDTTPTDPAADITEKNVDPSITLKVKEDSTNTFGTTNTEQIGKTVYYQLEIAAKHGAKDYIVHETLTDGLTFDANSVEIKDGNKTLVAGTDYQLVTNPTDKDTFEIKFEKAYLDSISNDTNITITYSAALNKNAADKIDAQDDAAKCETNTAKLTWGDKSTTSEAVTTYTKKFVVHKYDGTTDKAEQDRGYLAGAVFTLKNGDGVPVKLVKVENETYRIADATETQTAVDSFTTTGDGVITIQGADVENYTLTETKAPDGYNKLKDTVAANVADSNATHVDVANMKGTELPSTGGRGTKMIYILGAVLVLGTGVVLVSRKRMNGAEK